MEGCQQLRHHQGGVLAKCFGDGVMKILTVRVRQADVCVECNWCQCGAMPEPTEPDPGIQGRSC
jgi:hypothetical protein